MAMKQTNKYEGRCMRPYREQPQVGVAVERRNGLKRHVTHYGASVVRTRVAWGRTSLGCIESGDEAPGWQVRPPLARGPPQVRLHGVKPAAFRA